MVIRTKQDNISKCLLIGRCECDDILRFPFYWCEEIIDEAKKKGIDVIDLKRENFCEEKVTKHLTETKPNFVFLNGHGEEWCAKGYKQNPVITMNKNDHLLINKVVHIISCKTALLLGQVAMDKGCKGYIGYNGLFYIKNKHADPDKDDISKMFMEAVNIVSKTLLNGGGVKDAYDKSQKTYEEKISQCKGKYFDINLSDTERDFMHGVIGDLEANKRNQIFIS